MIKKYKKSTYRWVHNTFGTNLRLTEAQSAIGGIQLKKLKFFIKKRNYNSQKIFNCLKEFKSVVIPIIPKNITHAFYRCYIQINSQYLNRGWSRNKIIDNLIKKNVSCNEGSCSELYRERSFVDIGYSLKKRHEKTNYIFVLVNFFVCLSGHKRRLHFKKKR